MKLLLLDYSQLPPRSSGRAARAAMIDDGFFSGCASLLMHVMIAVTQNAVKHLRELLESRSAGEGFGLRLAVHRGGCAGMEYVMKVDAAAPADRVFTQDGVSIIVDDESFSFLDGSSIDYVDSLNDSGFKVENPNAARSCGCGTSFEPKTH